MWAVFIIYFWTQLQFGKIHMSTRTAYLYRSCPDLCNPFDQSSWRRPRTCPDSGPYPWWFPSCLYQQVRQGRLPEPCLTPVTAWCNTWTENEQNCFHYFSPYFSYVSTRFTITKTGCDIQWNSISIGGIIAEVGGFHHAHPLKTMLISYPELDGTCWSSRMRLVRVRL